LVHNILNLMTNCNDIQNSKTLENQFIYPSPKGSKLILAAPSSPAMLGSVLRSLWGRGKRRTDEAERGARRSQNQ
jgi:hypothetical protein